MAESKATQGRRPATEKAGRAMAKSAKTSAKASKAAPKTTKAAPKTTKAAPKSAMAAPKSAKAAPKSAKAAKAAPRSGKAASDAQSSPAAAERAVKRAKAAKPRGAAAKAAPKSKKAAPRKGAARAGKETSAPRKVRARTASDAAKDAPPPPTDAAAAPPPVQESPASAPTPDRRTVVEDVARRYFTAVAAREPAAMASYWSQEGIQDSVPLGVFRGREAVRRLYQEMFTAVPDMDVSVERIIADDRVAAVQWRASGTFDGGPFQGVEPTGRRLELRGTDCLEIGDDGKIVRNTSVYDGAAVARTMGMLPPEDSGTERALRAGLNTVTKLRRAVEGLGRPGG